MEKLIYTGSQDELMKMAGQLVTFFEDIRGVKSASSNAFSEEMMRQYVPDDDHFAVHLIAMGCGEDYSFNKNGDFWPRAMLKKRHGSFVTNGHFFREHNNRDPKKRIGDVKASAWNDKMGRVELIVHGDKRKAEPEYERAKAGKVSSYSMSCRVPYDVCSCCGNKAKRSSVYCDHLKHHMTQWIPKFAKFAYAENPEGTFFDISDVANPADRTANHIEYLFSPEESDMAKAASGIREGFLFSDLQAKVAGVSLPEEIALGCSTPGRRAWMEKLATEETFIAKTIDFPLNQQTDPKIVFVKQAVTYGFDPLAIEDQQLEAFRTVEPGILFTELAKRAAVLPFLPFYAYTTGQTIKQSSEDPVYLWASERMLPTMFRDALTRTADHEVEMLFDAVPLDKSASCNIVPEVRKAIDAVADSFSIDKKIAKARILRNCAAAPEPCGSGGIKSANDVADDIKKKAGAFINAYAMYKVAFAETVAEIHGESAVDEPSLLLLTFPYKV